MQKGPTPIATVQQPKRRKICRVMPAGTLATTIVRVAVPGTVIVAASGPTMSCREGPNAA